MVIKKITLRAEAMYKRLANLYQRANASLVMADNLLPEAFIELANASEMVESAIEGLYQMNEELIETRDLLETECQQYQELFELAPDGYLITDPAGAIRKANHTASVLLNVSQQYLVGKVLVNFVASEFRLYFRSKLIQLCKSDTIKELVVPLQQSDGKSFEAAITATVARDQQGKPLSIRWLLRNISERRQGESESIQVDSDFCRDRSLHKHSKGETIPLNPQVIWYVHQGWVKLSTLCETGEEVLLGLAGEGMVFGSSITSLPTYQAVALSNVSLAAIYIAEIATSPKLSHALLPKINRRLQQTESFLAISGRRRVADRLHQLLQLLEQEVGKPVVEGVLLNVRLTHEDFASACCTTRVTITRLMSKLQQQGKIGFDSKKHIILKNLD
ncbi:helix-turn-helix domain-containing protein [Fischerella sp. PCC 9605]|uniref:helix-turn-helix domain-containing protein n=1 Tax=Fischerella sp. PCC 9605 TaxID=1173024 RepID=UPI000478E650